MAFPEQIEKLVTKLTELTEKDKVEWQETVDENAFLASVGDFVVTVSRTGSEQYGAYGFQILDGKGRTIDGALATLLGVDKDHTIRYNWERLGRLYELARRDALNADKAVSDLLSSLEKIA